MRRHLIQFEHALVPTDDIRLQFPLPDTYPPGFVRQRDTLHQPFIDPLSLFQIVNIFDLGDKITRRAVRMAHYRHRQQRPDQIAASGVIALFQRVGVNFPANQQIQLLKVFIQVFWPGELLERHQPQFVLGIAEKITQSFVGL